MDPDRKEANWKRSGRGLREVSEDWRSRLRDQIRWLRPWQYVTGGCGRKEGETSTGTTEQ